MIAFTKELCIRKTKIFGTKGEIEGDGEDTIKIFEFKSGKSSEIHSDTLNVAQH